ncbi:unnamed protein product [Lampetra planeri]
MAAQSQQLEDWGTQHMSVLRREAEDSYREDQRLALEALLSGGILAYRSLVEREGAEDFLDDDEMEAILASVEVSPLQHCQDEDEEQQQERGVGRSGYVGHEDKAGRTLEDARSLTYFPQMSDLEPPMLDLGWPDERDLINHHQLLLQPQKQLQHLQLQQHHQQLMQARSWRRLGIPVDEAMAMAGVMDGAVGPGLGVRGPAGPRVEVRFTPRARDEEPNCREAVLRLIRAARTVLALVCRSPSDPTILRELLDAARRRVPVYALVEGASLPAFLRACTRARAPLLAQKFVRIRTLSGLRFVTRSGARATGRVRESFLVADCALVATGTYGYTWSDGSLNRCSLVVLAGEACALYSDEFRHLYAQSEAVASLAEEGHEALPPSPPPAYSLLPQVPGHDLAVEPVGVRLPTPERTDRLGHAGFVDAVIAGERWPRLMAQRGLRLDRNSLQPQLHLLNHRHSLTDLHLKLADGAGGALDGRSVAAPPRRVTDEWLAEAYAHAHPEEPSGSVCRFCGNRDPLQEGSSRGAGDVVTAEKVTGSQSSTAMSSPPPAVAAAAASPSSTSPAGAQFITIERSAAIARAVLAAAAATATAAASSSAAVSSSSPPPSAAVAEVLGSRSVAKRDAGTQTEEKRRRSPDDLRSPLPLPLHVLPSAAAGTKFIRYQSLVDLRSDCEGSSGGGGSRGSTNSQLQQQQRQRQGVTRALNAAAGSDDPTRPANGRKANYTSIRATLESLLNSLSGTPGKRS